MSKKNVFKEKVFAGSQTIPVGFWFHFLENEKFQNALEDETIIAKNVAGHRQYSLSNQPDFFKLMSDGFLRYPNKDILKIKTVAEAKKLQPLGKNHPWIQQQVHLVQQQIANLSEDVVTFYNIFSPSTYYKFLFDTDGDLQLADAIVKSPEAVKIVLDVLALDIAVLAQAVIQEAGASGIYLCVQNVQDSRISSELYRKVIRESDLTVLKAAKNSSDLNILHICGYEGSKNDLTLYLDYDLPIVNWAVTTEKLSLKEGKELFKDKVVLGGFDNRPEGLLATGTRAEIIDYTKNLIAEAGSERLIIGADCSLPFDIDRQRLLWVKEAVAAVVEEAIIAEQVS